MTMVSKYMLRPDVWERVFNLFSDSLRGIKNKKQFEQFLNDFLSPTEKIMLSKRFATAVLLAKGNSYEEIKNTLRVTSATVAKMNVYIKYGAEGLNKVVYEVLKKNAALVLIEELFSIFEHPTKGLPKSDYYRRVKQREAKIRRLKKGI